MTEFLTIELSRNNLKKIEKKMMVLGCQVLISLLHLASGAVLGVDDPLTTPASEFFVNGKRPPGTLLLNILAKNEEVHLRRTLPQWALLIDYWVIGVDEFNTDDSVAVIHEILGHIPGEVVTVYGFDGMGPSWTELVEVGYKNYPQATHGIISDADFAPMNPRSYDKMGLDIRCSKHLFSIMTEDHLHKRKMDWIYRNVRGAKVTRRTHQVLEVPPLPEQLTKRDMFITEAGLTVDEREGGYQDRTGAVVKNLRYIGWLLKDLQEYPDDTRTLYYVAYAHFDNFMKAKDSGQPLTDAHWRMLSESEMFFEKRAALVGNFEERYFAIMKLGEITDRFRRNDPGGIDRAVAWYQMAIDMDDGRADALFYQGQLLRLVRRYTDSFAPLLAAARLEYPDRALFNWKYLYQCYTHLELGRLLGAMEPRDIATFVTEENAGAIQKSMARGVRGCGGNPAERAEMVRIESAWIAGRRGRKQIAAAAETKRAASTAAAAAAAKKAAAATATAGQRSSSRGSSSGGGISVQLSKVPGNYGKRGSLVKFEAPLRRFIKYMTRTKRLKSIKVALKPLALYKPLVEHLLGLQALLKDPFPRCRGYREKTRKYNAWHVANAAKFAESVVDVSVVEEWSRLATRAMAACR